MLHLRHVVKQAFDLTENGVKLPNRLRALGCPERFLDTRDVREVGKIANYWRISRHLTICSSRFRPYFADVELHPLPNYRESVSSQAIPRRFIHAEIQLLVHYELQSHRLRPRAIGVSKEACFLCDSFLRAHGRFYFTGAHRQMFPQWTVPDLKEYTSATVEHFRRTLSQVALDVKQEYLKTRKKLPWRPFPLQSAINLNVVHLATPSTSTLRVQPSANSSSNTKSISSRSSTTKSVCALGKERTFVHENQDEDPGGDRRHLTSSIVELKEPPNINSEVLREVSLDVKVDEADPGLTDWIRTFAYFSNLPIEKSSTLPQKRFTGGSINLEPAHADEQERTIHLADIPTKDTLVLERDTDESDSVEMSFVIVGQGGRSVRFHCRWQS